MNMMVVTAKFTGRQCVPGMTTNIPFVSPASHRWYCITKVSREQVPMNANAREEADRRIGLAFLRMTKAHIGRKDI
jgi:hypothetical protein